MNFEDLQESVNPYHYIRHCLLGKWKMTILHHIHTYGNIRFNNTLKTLPISEKVFSQQLKELVDDGLIRRIQYETIPVKVEYVLTPAGERIVPALDQLYIWSIKRMAELKIPIDPDAFLVHKSEKYIEALKDLTSSSLYR